MSLAGSNGSVRRWLANAVAVLHLGIVAFFALGWLLPSPIAYLAVIFGGAGLIVIWHAFGDRCPLTVLEERLRQTGRDRGSPTPSRDEPPVAETHFVSMLLSRVLGRPVSRRIGDRVVYGVLFLSMFISALRLVMR